MDKNVKYALYGLGAIIVIYAIMKVVKEQQEPKINEEMEALIKKIDQAKK